MVMVGDYVEYRHEWFTTGVIRSSVIAVMDDVIGLWSDEVMAEEPLSRDKVWRIFRLQRCAAVIRDGSGRVDTDILIQSMTDWISHELRGADVACMMNHLPEWGTRFRLLAQVLRFIARVADGQEGNYECR